MDVPQLSLQIPGPVESNAEAHAVQRPRLSLHRHNEACVTAQDEAERKEDAKREACFESAIKETLNLPSGYVYVKVAVLVIRWDDEHDVDGHKAGHDKEISELGNLLQSGFNFTFREVKLKTSTSKKPQNALNAAITQHIQEFDDPNGLLIIYYTGHGVLHGPRGDQQLELSANREAHRNITERYAATASWHQAEPSLLHSADADVLAIFDCCYASNAHKGYTENHRVYHLLAAVPRDYTTPGPGEHSFTSRLITALQELLEEHQGGSFPTSKLVARINKKNKRPHGLPAMLHDRLETYNGRSISLARLDNQAAKQKQELIDQQPRAAARLHLSFSLQGADLKDEQIKALARELPTAFNNANVKLCRVNWGKFDRKRTYTWREIVRARVLAERLYKSYSSPRVNNNSVEPTIVDTEPQLLQHITSRDNVGSPSPILEDSTDADDTTPLLPPTRPCSEKQAGLLIMCRRFLGVVRRRCAAVVESFQVILTKSRVFRFSD